MRIGVLPAAPPELDRRRLVGLGVAAEGEDAAWLSGKAYRSVSFSSMRRLLVGVFGLVGVERLEFAETGGDEMLGRIALR